MSEARHRQELARDERGKYERPSLMRRVKTNLQFMSPRGLARNGLAGLFLGFMLSSGLFLVYIGLFMKNGQMDMHTPAQALREMNLNENENEYGLINVSYPAPNNENTLNCLCTVTDQVESASAPASTSTSTSASSPASLRANGVIDKMGMYLDSEEKRQKSEMSTYSFESSLIPFGFYLVVSAFFYIMEFVWHALFHPETVDFDAWILYTHSKAFHIALVVSLIEYVVEAFFWPSMKRMSYFHFMGLGLTVIGQYIREKAMYTAGSNFTHVISTSKKQTHALITTGIYAWSRHPSYCGWFWWATGTQILLANPLCIVGFTLASWSFFYQRIPFEEIYLVKFFGDEYLEYRERVSIGIPFLEWAIERKRKRAHGGSKKSE